MINLLPYETKKQLKASRSNAIWLRFLIILCVAMAFLLGACAVTAFLLQSGRDINNALTSNPNLTSETIEINRQADDALTNLNFAKTIFNEQISYSYLLTSLDSILPDGAVLGGFSVDNNSINNELTLLIKASSADQTSVIASGFKNSPVFSSYTLISAKQDGTDQYHPTTITIKVKINKEALK